MNIHVKLTMVCLMVVASQPASWAQGLGGAPASNSLFDNGSTASQGCSGSINAPTSDVTMTQNNNPSTFFIQPPSNTSTATTRQSTYQSLTSGLPTGAGLLAPSAGNQYGDNGSFNYAYSAGFPSPQPRAVYGGGAPIYAGSGGAFIPPGANIGFAPPTGPLGCITGPPGGISIAPLGSGYGGCYGGCGLPGGISIGLPSAGIGFGGCGIAGGIGIGPCGISGGIGGNYGPLSGGLGFGGCGITGSFGGCFGIGGFGGCFGF